MMRRWVGAAVMAGCLGLVQAARAQFPPVGPGGPARPPEPIPVGAAQAPVPDSEPNLVPGPLTPQLAPEGPPDSLSLPADGTGAFPSKATEPDSGTYFHIGALMWRRENSSSGVIAVQDPQNLDTGTPPPAGAPVLQRFDNIDPGYNAGITATLGALWNGNECLEATVFYTFQGRNTSSLADPGRIDSFFVNPPLGFEGDNGMFLQDDRLSTTLTSQLWGAEVNYRYADPALSEAELLLGVRYLDLFEKLGSTFDDDGIQFPMTNGLPDPTRIATYDVQTENRFVGPQLGFEWGHRVGKFFTLGVTAKAALGADFAQLNRSLTRGDGYVGFDGNRGAVQFSEVYEGGAFLDFHVLERARIRLAYNALWFSNMANVVDQYDFNLQNTNQFDKRNGSVLFHGPLLEFQFLF